MARTRMVTRTVEVTVAEVMCLNPLTAEVSIRTLEVSGVCTPQDVLKQVQKAYDTEDNKCVVVQEFHTKEVLYGMKEVDFIRLAEVLPPRKAGETEE